VKLAAQLTGRSSHYTTEQLARQLSAAQFAQTRYKRGSKDARCASPSSELQKKMPLQPLAGKIAYVPGE
jgi:hypothetical protein